MSEKSVYMENIMLAEHTYILMVITFKHIDTRIEEGLSVGESEGVEKEATKTAKRPGKAACTGVFDRPMN